MVEAAPAMHHQASATTKEVEEAPAGATEEVEAAPAGATEEVEVAPKKGGARKEDREREQEKY